MRAENWSACLRSSNRRLRTVFEISLRLKRFLKNSCPAMLSRRGRRPVCPAEQSSALRVIAHQWCRLGRKTDRNYDYLPIGSGLSRSKLPPAGARPPRRGRLGLCVRREIALNGSSEAGPFQSTLIGRVFHQTVWAFAEHPFVHHWDRVGGTSVASGAPRLKASSEERFRHAFQGGRASLAWADGASAPTRAFANRRLRTLRLLPCPGQAVCRRAGVDQLLHRPV